MSNENKINGDWEIDKIHLEQDYEVKAWCQIFDISMVDLKHAVEVVGPSAVKVKEYLNQQNLKTRNTPR